MMRSMFSGVTGLKAHQTRMDVIGNNVANVNTVGYKAGRVLFQDVFNQTLSSAGAPDPTSGRGGTNPMQVGLGLGIASIDTITTRGSVERTDNPTDLSIEGDGYFIVKGGNNSSYNFSRAGDFSIDKLGNVVTAGGLGLYGWQEYSKDSAGNVIFNTEKNIEPLNIFEDTTNGNKRVIAAKATENATFSGNLDAMNPKVVDPTTVVAPAVPPDAQFTMPFTTFDSLGNQYKINVEFYKTDVQPNATATGYDSTWRWLATTGTGETLNPAVGGTIVFNEYGAIPDDPANPGQKPVWATPTLTIVPDADVGAADMEVVLDFSNLTMFAADSSAKPSFVDGYQPGSLTTFNIGADGIITGVYSNGQQQPIGLLALATFENPAGLQKLGSNLFIQTTNSGDFRKAVRPGKDGAGTINPGTLEMSNVDLSKEFTEMIITQRGFQANSRIITSSDEMLQELINLKR